MEDNFMGNEVKMFRNILIILLTGALILAACAPQSAGENEAVVTNPATLPPAATSSATDSHNDGVTPPSGSKTEQPSAAPWQPSAMDKNLSQSEAFVTSAEVLTLESFPPQYTLTIKGNLPTPCHQLRVEVSEPDAKNQIRVQAYSVVDPNKMCIQVLEPFEENIPLGSLPTGQYTVTVNGEPVSQIEAP
jgi:hypothetical protein